MVSPGIKIFHPPLADHDLPAMHGAQKEVFYEAMNGKLSWRHLAIHRPQDNLVFALASQASRSIK